jgi:hypothetical protein
MNTKNIFWNLFLVNIVCCGNVLAYDSSDDAKVKKERQADAYKPLGINAGGFTILPKLDINNEYNTNIFYRDGKVSGGVVDSYIAHFMPGVTARSNWTRHALNLKFDSDITQYSNLGNQANYQDLFTTVDGRIDIARDSHFDTAFAYNSIHENRASPDQINGIGPTFYDTKNINGFYNQKLNRVSVKAGVDTIRYDYQNVQTSLGTPLQMASRNHWEYMPTVRLGYEIQPEYEAYVKFVYKDASYDSGVYANGVVTGTPYNRNSGGYNALTGLAFELTNLVTGDASVGYVERSYNDARLTSIAGVNGFVNLKWRPTTLTTVNGKFSRDINETTQAGVSGVFGSTFALGVEHELLRNVILVAGGNYTNNQYQGFVTPYAGNRVDDIYGGNAGVKYLFNRNLSTDLSYTYQTRNTNYALTNYEVNQVMLNLKGHF